MNIPKDLVAASSIPLILSILMRKPSYGYAIIKEVKNLSDHEMHWTEGMLYPVLHRLAEQKLVETYWEKKPNERKRKYYRITEAGRQELEEQKKKWALVDRTLNRSWNNELYLNQNQQFDNTARWCSPSVFAEVRYV